MAETPPAKKSRSSSARKSYAPSPIPAEMILYDDGDVKSEPAEEDEEWRPLEACSQDLLHGEPKGKPRRFGLRLQEDVEEAMVVWIKSHELLYNKKLRAYKDTQKKAMLWENKAAELDVYVKDLQVWYESLRSRYGRLTQKQSGFSAKDRSERDNWILERFAFLNGHIVRLTQRAGCTLKAKRFAGTNGASGVSQGGPLSQSDDGAEEEEEEGDSFLETASEGTLDFDGHESSSQTPLSSTAHLDAHLPWPRMGQPPFKVRAMGGGKRSAAPWAADPEPLSERLQDRRESSRVRLPADRLRESSSPVVAADPGVSSRTSWGQWMTSMMPSVHEDLWPSFLQRTFDTVMWYASESEKLRQGGPHPQPPHPP